MYYLLFINSTLKFKFQQPSRSNPKQVLCHQCGSLFSGEKGNANCEIFDQFEQSQRKYCDPGEACLWYSWQKSASEIATIRECFSPTILLGSVDDPLTVKSSCKPKDISETPGASIMACLCNNDLCNAFDEAKLQVYSSISSFTHMPSISEILYLKRIHK